MQEIIQNYAAHFFKNYNPNNSKISRNISNLAQDVDKTFGMQKTGRVNF